MTGTTRGVFLEYPEEDHFMKIWGADLSSESRAPGQRKKKYIPLPGLFRLGIWLLQQSTGVNHGRT
jgi:hypothetical protein